MPKKKVLSMAELASVAGYDLDEVLRWAEKTSPLPLYEQRLVWIRRPEADTLVELRARAFLVRKIKEREEADRQPPVGFGAHVSNES